MKLNFKAKIFIEDTDFELVNECLEDIFPEEADWDVPTDEYHDEKGRTWNFREYLSRYNVFLDEEGKELKRDEIYSLVLITPVLEEADKDFCLRILKQLARFESLENAMICIHLAAEAKGEKIETDFDSEFGTWTYEDCQNCLEGAFREAREKLADELLK